MVPAVNQLRYAGEHLAQYACEPSPACRSLLLRKAYNHCRRAYYDSIECTIAILLGNFARLQRGGYARIELEQVWPGYKKSKAVLLDAQRTLEQIGTLKSLTDTEQLALEDKVDALYGAYNSLRKALDEIDNRRIEQTRAIACEEREAKVRADYISKQQEDRRYWLAFALTIFGIIISLVGLFK